MKISVVIPVLNEAEHLAACLKALSAGPVAEIIVVDGGSTDASRQMAAAAGARVLQNAPGRGGQLRHGVAAASSPWLLLLHGDTVLMAGWAQAVAGLNPDQAGYFRLRLNSRKRAARVLEWIVAWRCRLLALPYGDQGLLIHRDLLARVGGVPDLALMEDVVLARRLGRRRLVCLRAEALTSAARYQRGGFVRRPMRNFFTLLLYFAGVQVPVLARLYGRK